MSANRGGRGGPTSDRAHNRRSYLGLLVEASLLIDSYSSLTATQGDGMPEGQDRPLRVIVRADDAQWEKTERLLAGLPRCTRLVGEGSWRVLEVEATTS